MRKIRRMAGYLKRCLSEMRVSELTVPFRKNDRRSNIPALVRGTLVGFLSGAQTLREIENVSTEITSSLRKMLKLRKRLPDTTVRDNMVKLSLGGLRNLLRGQIVAAWKRKAIEKLMKLPFHVVSMDGKWVSVDCLKHDYVQKRVDEKTHRAFGMLRTITCALVSTRACPCIDTIPVPGETNEMGFFQTAFKELLTHWTQLFQVVMYDAGADSRENAETVVSAGKDYIFRLKNERRQRYQLAKMLLKDASPLAETEDLLTQEETVKRTLFVVEIKPRTSAKKEPSILYSTTQTLLAVRSQKFERGELVSDEHFYYDTSLRHDALSAEQWLFVLRRRWGVENDIHGTLDVAFKEDDRLGIRTEPDGTLALMLLRRIAYNIVAFFRKVTLRGELSKDLPYRDIFRWVLQTLHIAHEIVLADLRNRPAVANDLL